MRFTFVIFNTYNFYLEFYAQRLVLSLLVFKSSFSYGLTPISLLVSKIKTRHYRVAFISTYFTLYFKALLSSIIVSRCRYIKDHYG